MVLLKPDTTYDTDATKHTKPRIASPRRRFTQKHDLHEFW